MGRTRGGGRVLAGGLMRGLWIMRVAVVREARWVGGGWRKGEGWAEDAWWFRRRKVGMVCLEGGFAWVLRPRLEKRVRSVGIDTGRSPHGGWVNITLM